MAKLLTDVTGSGTWLRVEEDGIGVLGADQQPKPTAGRPFTVTWLGAPSRPEIVKFCKEASAVLTAGLATSQITTRGRAVVAGRINTFSGRDWLHAVRPPDADFVRLELSLLQSDLLAEGFEHQQ